MISLRRPRRTVKTEKLESAIHQAEKARNPSNITVQRLVSLSGTGDGELQFESQDWADYADLSKLPRRSGVTSDLLRRLVLKELVDNALDECDRVERPGKVTISRDGANPNKYTVTDEGEGLNGTAEEIAGIFSLCRPKATSKLWRLPKRGAVGNGIRVIVGAVASGGGRIIIKTRGRSIVLRPQAHNGITEVESVIPIKLKPGTSITIEINPSCPKDEQEMFWAKIAIQLATHGAESVYRRRANPLWLDLDHLCEMLRSVTRGTSVRDFTAKLDGCTSSESRKQITQAFGLRKLCSDMTRDQSGELLCLLQRFAKPVKAKYLGLIGDGAWGDGGAWSDAYCKGAGEFETGDNEPTATIPFVVECWAKAIGRDGNRVDLSVFTINRTPAIGDSRCQRRYMRAAFVNLCGSMFDIDVAEGEFRFALNLTSPCIPIVSEGKMPDLSPFKGVAKEVIEKALRLASRHLPPKPPQDEDDDEEDDDDDEEKPERIFQKDVIRQVLPEAIERSGDGGYQFPQRSLFYRVRILVKEFIDVDIKYGTFCGVITDYENESGEIERMYRDTRGVYCEPHGGEVTAMGTLSVDEYVRMAWKYSNVLFLEKEDLVHALKQSGFLDRWDCLALSSKGFSSRAARDLIDKIGASKEEQTKFFCVHDADASGSVVKQALTDATKARAARTVEIIDLGFFPWTALAEGLLREPAKKKKWNYRRPVADYIKKRDADNKENGNPNNEPNWQSWLQDWRVELNAMTTKELVEWIDLQFEKHHAAKVIPPEKMALESVTASVAEQLKEDADEEVRDEREDELQELQDKMDALEEEILEEVTKRAEERIKEIKFPNSSEIVEKIKEWLKENKSSHWRNSIHEVALELIPETATARTGCNQPESGRMKR